MSGCGLSRKGLLPAPLHCHNLTLVRLRPVVTLAHGAFCFLEALSCPVLPPSKKAAITPSPMSICLRWRHCSRLLLLVDGCSTRVMVKDERLHRTLEVELLADLLTADLLACQG
jgi:hypothetical protein